MTKVIDLTQEKKAGKPIEFIYYISLNGSMATAGTRPAQYNYVQRVAAADDVNKFDIIEAFDAPDGHRYRYLGHWNDGHVEK